MSMSSSTIKPMHQISDLKQNLQSNSEAIEFQDVIDLIDELYDFTPTEFTNGAEDKMVINKAGENNGSCKIFYFSQLQGLDEQETLHCFGKYYRIDVLTHPDNNDHANIRSFIKYGWNNIKFAGKALTLKQTEK